MLDNTCIEKVNEYRVLGVMLDHKICWKPRVRHVKAKSVTS